MVGKTLGFRHSSIDEATRAISRSARPTASPSTVGPDRQPTSPCPPRRSPARRPSPSTALIFVSTVDGTNDLDPARPSTLDAVGAGRDAGLHPRRRRLRGHPRRHGRHAHRPVVRPAHRRRSAIPQPPAAAVGPVASRTRRTRRPRCFRSAGAASTSGTTSPPTRAPTCTSCRRSTRRPTPRFRRDGCDHPISWCQNFEGGRSWYQGCGHTDVATPTRRSAQPARWHPVDAGVVGARQLRHLRRGRRHRRGGRRRRRRTR